MTLFSVYDFGVFVTRVSRETGFFSGLMDAE